MRRELRVCGSFRRSGCLAFGPPSGELSLPCFFVLHDWRSTFNDLVEVLADFDDGLGEVVEALLRHVLPVLVSIPVKDVPASVTIPDGISER